MMMTNDAPQQYLTTRENSLVPTPLPNGDPDQCETAFVRLLAEAIASDIRRGGTLADEPLDEPDEEISADAEERAAEVRKAEEAGDEP